MGYHKVTVIGIGYVGLVTAACLAEIGHQVMGLDIDEAKIAALKQGKVPVYEPGLEDLVARNLNIRLRFTTSYAEAIPWSEIVMVAVGTPDDGNGDADLRYLWQVADSLTLYIQKPTVVAIKSTVPVGVCDQFQIYLRQKLGERIGPAAGALISVVSNPEFLREGRAVSDFMKADRVVIGGSDSDAISLIKELYEPLEVPFVLCDTRSSELIKYASNAFLATKVSFINSIARLCEKLGADVLKVAEGMGYDHRIMPEHLRAGLGYGGSCFPKDTAALLRMAERCGYRFEILEAAVRVNEGQVDWVVEKLEQVLGDLVGKTIAVWGLAFKPNTDDLRESQALKLAERLAGRGARVQAYDPALRFNPKSDCEGVVICTDKYEAVRSAEALVVGTEWSEFVEADFEKVCSLMTRPFCVDARNCLARDLLLGLGFCYLGVGWGGAGKEHSAKQVVGSW